jgi:magnesium chelatase subunit I
VRLRLDVLMAFTANPEDYTARGKIITPLKDRIGSEIRTHYAATRHEAMAITAQEAWLERHGNGTLHVPPYVREIVEEIAFQARGERRIDKRSGVSQRLPISALENVASNAERRALVHREVPAVAGIADVYAALPAITGKFELEYEGELRGADQIARELIRAAVANVFDGYFQRVDLRSVVDWFDGGESLHVDDNGPSATLLGEARRVPGLLDAARHVGRDATATVPAHASAVGFVLEGLYATRKISRSDDRGYHGAEPVAPRRAPRAAAEEAFEDLRQGQQGKKKYYN